MTRTRQAAIIGVAASILVATILVFGACSAPTAPATSAPSKPAEPPKSVETAKPPVSPESKAAESAKPAPQATKPAAPAAGPLPEIKFAEALSFANGPVYWAVEKGYFRQNGVEVKFDPMAGAGDVVPFLASGQLDMAGGGLSAAHFNAFNRGLEVKIVAPLGLMPPDRGSVRIVMRSDLYDQAPVKNATALKGLKVAVNTKGGVVEYILTKALQKEGMDLKDVEVVTMPFPDMPAALSGGSVGAIVAAEPNATRAIQLGAGKLLLDQIVPGKSTTVLLVSPKLISERSDVLKNFMVAYMQGVRDLQDISQLYTDEKMAVWTKYLKLQPDIIKAMAPFAWDPDLNIQRDIIRDQEQVHRSHGLLNYDKPLDVEKMIDETFVKYAREKLGPWKK